MKAKLKELAEKLRICDGLTTVDNVIIEQVREELLKLVRDEDGRANQAETTSLSEVFRGTRGDIQADKE